MGIPVEERRDTLTALEEKDTLTAVEGGGDGTGSAEEPEVLGKEIKVLHMTKISIKK